MIVASEPITIGYRSRVLETVMVNFCLAMLERFQSGNIVTNKYIMTSNFAKLGIANFHYNSPGSFFLPIIK